MANFNSIPVNFGDVQAPGNLDLMGKVLMGLQDRYDKNVAEVDQTLAELKQQENLLLRDSDKQRFASNIQLLLNEVNKNGGTNLSSKNLTRKIKTYISSALDDYTVEQIGNSQNIRNFYTTVSEKQKKNDGTYSTTNVNDAIELAGVDKYLKNETDAIGNLQYNDYVNINEKLNKKAEEYIKTMGIETLMDTTTGEYYMSDVYGKRVTKEEIYQKLKNELDEKDRTQLQINTRQSLGKLSAEDLHNSLSPVINSKLSDIKQSRAKIQAQLSTSTDKVEKEALKSSLVQIDSQIKNYSDQINNRKYDIYNIYQEEVLSNIASNYDIEVITDIKRTDIPLQIKKFEFDKAQDERNYQLKLREVEAKEKEVGATISPTMIEKPQVGETQKPSEQILNESVRDSDIALDMYLRNTNENGYNQKSAEEQWVYKTNLKTGDPSFSVEKQNLIKNFQTALQGYTNIVNTNKAQLKNSTSEMFNNITGANLDNLSVEMPYTVAMLRQKKKFENLDGNQQAAVMLEMGSNVAKNMATGREKTVLMSTLNSLRASLANHKSEKVKAIYDTVNKAYSNIEGGKVIGTEIVETPVGLTKRDIYATGSRGNRPFAQDTDVTELEVYAGDSKVSGQDLFSKMLSGMLSNANRFADGYKSNLVSNRAMAWSTEDKNQKNDAIKIQQTIQANYPESRVAKTNNFIISRKGSGYEVAYDEEVGKDVQRVVRYLEKLPEDMVSKINLKEQKWHSSFLNPNIVLPKFNFSPKMRVESYENFKNIARNRPDIIPPNAFVALHNRQSLAGTEFQSDEDIMDWVEQQPTFTPNKQSAVSNVINANYSTNFEVFNGILQGNITVTYPNGRKDLILMNSQQKELDEGKLFVETMQKVNEYKVNKITEILNANR